MSEPARRQTPETAAQRQARLRSLGALQRDTLAASWQQLVPTLNRVDSALSRLRRLRRHPVALGLLAVSASGLFASRRARGLIGGARSGWRLAVRAATLVSVWRAMRVPIAVPAAPPAGHAGRTGLKDATAPRASADVRPD